MSGAPAPAARAPSSGLPGAIAAALAAVSHLTVLRFPFAGDDGLIYGNAASSSLSRSLLAYNVDAADSAPWWLGVEYQRRYARLVPSALLSIEARLFGRGATGYHVVSLALHVASVWLLYRLLCRLVDDPRLAAIAASIAAVHPCVNEIVGTMSSQPLAVTATLSLLAVCAWTRFRDADSAPWLAAALVAAFAAMTGYEAAVTLPLVLVVGDLALLPRGSWRPRVLALGLLVAYVPVFWAVRRGVVHPETASTFDLGDAWRSLRLDGLTYVHKTVAIVDPRRPFAYIVLDAAGEPGVWLVAAAPVVAALAFARRRPPALAALAAWALLLAPPLLTRATLSTLNGPSLRQVYLPLFALTAVVALALRHVRRPAIAAACTGAFVAAAAALSLAEGPMNRNVAARRRIVDAVRAATADAPPGAPWVLVGAAPCGLIPSMSFPQAQISRAIPVGVQGLLPMLRRLDDATVLAFAPTGFDLPSAEGERFARREGYAPEESRARRALPPLVTEGEQVVDGATVTVVNRGPRGVVGLRVAFDRPLDDIVFVGLRGCDTATRIHL